MTKLGNLTLSDIKPYLTIKPAINTVLFLQNHYKKKIPEIDKYKHKIVFSFFFFFFNKNTTAVRWEKYGLLNRWYWVKWKAIRK